jgi:pimeloyl-ACP methyl ester carboxylesterase
MATILLVPGAFHGGWYYSPILPQLRAAGHDVYTITLSGLAGPADRPFVSINLDTHIEDVVSLVELEQLKDIVLCGHSYGGLVIAGAADRLQGHIRTLLFLDALVPADGESVWTTWPSEVRDMFIRNATDGLLTPPPPGVDPRARAHPLATFLQPVRLSANAYASVKNKAYVWCNGQPGSLFEPIYNRVAADPSWSAHTMACGHDFMNEAPQLALERILDAASL